MSSIITRPHEVISNVSVRPCYPILFTLPGYSQPLFVVWSTAIESLIHIASKRSVSMEL